MIVRQSEVWHTIAASLCTNLLKPYDTRPGLVTTRPQLKLRSQTQDWTPPWAITFDLRERETQWTAENQARLVKLFAAQKLDIDILEAELRVAQLCLIVPRLRDRLKTIKPDTLAELLIDPSTIASRLADLKEALREADISGLVSLAPQLLLQDKQVVIDELRSVARILKIDFGKAQRVVSNHPRFLDSELVQEAIDELQRLMPGRNASAILQAEPSWLLRVERGPKRLGPHPDDI